MTAISPYAKAIAPALLAGILWVLQVFGVEFPAPPTEVSILIAALISYFVPAKGYGEVPEGEE